MSAETFYFISINCWRRKNQGCVVSESMDHFRKTALSGTSETSAGAPKQIYIILCLLYFVFLHIKKKAMQGGMSK